MTARRRRQQWQRSHHEVKEGTHFCIRKVEIGMVDKGTSTSRYVGPSMPKRDQVELEWRKRLEEEKNREKAPLEGQECKRYRLNRHTSQQEAETEEPSEDEREDEEDEEELVEAARKGGRWLKKAVKRL